MNAQDLAQRIRNLVSLAGIEGEILIHRLEGGANNKAFEVEAEGLKVLAKVYFHHPDDPRDRLEAEFAFSSFAWDQGVWALPRPIASDWHFRIGLFEFIQGRRLEVDEVDGQKMEQAIRFYKELNRHKHLPGAREGLAKASEACFSLREHCSLVERRLHRLQALEPFSKLEHDAVRFIRTELVPAWSRILAKACEEAQRFGLGWDEEISGHERCLSPSDFGFHNALLNRDGLLRVIDFEYAGWDDPAKMVCDFFCQPAVPVSMEYFDHFAQEVASGMEDPEIGLQRMQVLLPVYRIKWCCILLNEFLPTGRARRHFSRDPAGREASRSKQLEKAKDLLGRTLFSFAPGNSQKEFEDNGLCRFPLTAP